MTSDFRFLAYAFFLAFTVVWVSRTRRLPRLWRVFGVIGLFVVAAATVQFREGRVDWLVWGLASGCALVSIAFTRMHLHKV